MDFKTRNRYIAVFGVIASILFVAGFIVGTGIGIINDYLTVPETREAKWGTEIGISYYNDEVYENVSVFNYGFKINRDRLYEGAELLLRFTNLNNSKIYRVMIDIKGGYLNFFETFSNASWYDVPIVIDRTIMSITLCAYEYDLNNTSLELYSVTLYPLIWIQFEWM